MERAKQGSVSALFVAAQVGLHQKQVGVSLLIHGVLKLCQAFAEILRLSFPLSC